MAPPKGHPRYGGGWTKGQKTAKVKAREAGQARALREAEITAERTMRELGRIGFSDVGEVFDDAGNLRAVRSLPASVRATVASVKTLKTNAVSGDGQQETTREVKLWDKLAALNLLAKHFGLVTEKHEHEHTFSDELLARLDSGRLRNAKR